MNWLSRPYGNGCTFRPITNSTFNKDSDKRRREFLRTVSQHEFFFSTVTFDKIASLKHGMPVGTSPFTGEEIYGLALREVAPFLNRAKLVVDGAVAHAFRKQLAVYVRQHINSGGVRNIADVRVTRSSSESLIQLADYVAGVTNRILVAKEWADEYETCLYSKRRGYLFWP